MNDVIATENIKEIISCGKLNIFDFSQREGFLKKYGVSSQSFTTLQPGLDYFDVPDIGYIAFTKKYGNVIVLSDPVCNSSYFETILLSFNEKYPHAVYVQCSPVISNILNKHFGYFATQIGTEYQIYLKSWSFSGKSKKSIRQSINQVIAQGIIIKEESHSADLQKISDNWLQTRSCKVEIEFLIRPLHMPYKKGVRYFIAYKDEKPVGFIMFDPIYKDGQVIAYIPNISRSWKGFKQGLWYALIAHAIEKFKDEGIEYIDLGLTPLSLSKIHGPHESKIFRYFLSLIYQYGNAIYNFKGLEFSKQRFKAEVTKTYVSHKKTLPLWQLISVFRKCRII